MSRRLSFLRTFFDYIQQYDYVLFDYSTAEKSFYTFYQRPIYILMSKKDLDLLILKSKSYPHQLDLNIDASAWETKITIEFDDKTALEVCFLHKLIESDLVFLPAKEVFANRIFTKNKWYRASYEHLIEYALLKNILNSGGMEEYQYNFFKEFHYLLQEDLLDYINSKYQTGFVTLYNLTYFDEREYNKIVHKLSSCSENQRMKSFSPVWIKYWGGRDSRRQA